MRWALTLCRPQWCSTRSDLRAQQSSGVAFRSVVRDENCLSETAVDRSNATYHKDGDHEAEPCEVRAYEKLQMT